MYRIIGTDGKEYGPVTADQVKQWINEGRANADTKVLPAGGTEWKRLGDLPEFAAACAARPGAAPPPPIAPQPKVEPAFVQELLARDYHLDITGCISRGFNLVFANFWLCVGASFLIWLLLIISGFIPFGSLLLGYVLWGGLEWMFLKLSRGQKAEIADAFAGFSMAFAQLLLFSLVGQILTMVGLVLCILPGIYLAVCWMLFSQLLILDKGLEFWPAMELSRKVVTKHWWAVFALCLLCLLISLGGLIVCIIGLFVAMPICIAAKVYAYEEIFGARLALPPAPGSAGVSPAGFKTTNL